MQDVRCVRGFRATPLRLQLRTAGTAYAGNASGNFRLADGGSARVFVEAGATDALLIQASGARYLYAPRSFEPFLAEARRSHPGGVRDGRQPGR